jgi:hypothetical protein
MQADMSLTAPHSQYPSTCHKLAPQLAARTIAPCDLAGIDTQYQRHFEQARPCQNRWADLRRQNRYRRDRDE